MHAYAREVPWRAGAHPPSVTAIWSLPCWLRAVKSGIPPEKRLTLSSVIAPKLVRGLLPIRLSDWGGAAAASCTTLQFVHSHCLFPGQAGDSCCIVCSRAAAMAPRATSRSRGRHASSCARCVSARCAGRYIVGLGALTAECTVLQARQHALPAAAAVSCCACLPASPTAAGQGGVPRRLLLIQAAAATCLPAALRVPCGLRAGAGRR